LSGAEESVSARAAALISLEKAYSFLDTMTNPYPEDSTLRLSQSYVPTAALDLDEGFPYDKAAALIALFLPRGPSENSTMLRSSLARTRYAATGAVCFPG